jgi:hypothetical protein
MLLTVLKLEDTGFTDYMDIIEAAGEIWFDKSPERGRLSNYPIKHPNQKYQTNITIR